VLEGEGGKEWCEWSDLTCHIIYIYTYDTYTN
jgi:hypothetical protein